MTPNFTHSPAATVLLVEDDLPVLEVVSMLLANLGYRVISTASAEDAITQAREHQPGIDIMLTDLLMPGMKGRQLAEIIGEIDPDIKIIFMSGNFSDLDPQDIRENFLQKPFGRRELAQKMAEVVQQLPCPPLTGAPGLHLQPESVL